MTGSSIDRYISQAKLNHPEQVNEEMYELLVGDIFQMVVKHCGLSTNLKFVFTPSRRAERLRLCGESWLIYDQYLGQTFNLLNRLFFNAEGEKEAITYFHKYIAERALEHGRAEFGVSLANIYADNRDRVRETVNGDPLRPAFTIVSEQFAIFHELSHEILDSGHDFAEFFMSLVADSIDARREVRRTQTRESLIDGFRTSDPAAYHDAPLDQVIAETLADYDSPTLGDLWNNEGKRAYLNRLQDEGILPAENEMLPQPVESSGAVRAPRRNQPPLRPPQTTFIPADAPRIQWTAAQHRVRAVWEELQSLTLREHPNAVSALMRILVELSVESYIAEHGLVVADNLSRKVGAVASHLLQRQIIDRAYFDELERIRMADQLISVASMQRYIHSPDFAPMENELRTYWARLGRFLQATLSR
ncbi:hypothetical protein QTN93_01155 [Sphingomonas aerolata]|uniref:hypothetical protein n=1 Tax=Sphingomonas aerolata TaxID=185951 RepID=UPI0035A5976F